MWRVNQRIVKLIAELMRNHDSPEALVILASASDLLLRATDGMLVDGEACTLPQLEVTFLSFIRSRDRRIPFNKIVFSVPLCSVVIKRNQLYHFPRTTNSHDILYIYMPAEC
jgi:hypothetical protein